MAELLKDYPQADELAVKALVDMYVDDQKYIDDIAEGKVEVPPALNRTYEKTHIGMEIINDEEELKNNMYLTNKDG